MTTVEPGIRRTPSGWQVFVRIDGEFRSKHFKPQTPLVELRRWRERQKARKTLDLPAESGPGLRADATTYLALDDVSAMPTIAERTRHLEAWVTAFGPTCDRKSITHVAIAQQLKRWRQAGASAATLNLRRTALSHLFTKLDGKSAVNPVRDVPKYPEPPRQWTLPTMQDAAHAIAHVHARANRAILSALQFTGWPGAVLQDYTPAALKAQAREVLAPGRRKGKATAPVQLLLLRQGVEALQELEAADAIGPYDKDTIRNALHVGCDRAKVPHFRVYDLRHLFLTEAAIAIKDERVVRALALHAPARASDPMTFRYTVQSVDPRLKTAMRTFQRHVDRLLK